MIVIVGAGLAGLAAAHKLMAEAKKGGTPLEFTILEARNRIGGRIESVNFEDGSRIDLGAQWLHGERNNPLYNWLESLDCIEGPEVEESEFEGVFSTPSGVIPSRELVARVLDLLMEAKSFLYKMAQTIDRHAKPVDIFRKYIEDESNRCQYLRAADKNLVKAVERWFELYEMIDNSCEDMSLLSLRAYSDWKDFDDGKMVLLKGGWMSVVTKLVDSIGTQKIRLNHRVERIRYDKSGVILSVIDDLDKTIEIPCDHVILTCSIGFLKSRSPNFFEPPLGEDRLSSIHNWGFGAINKIFLRFEEPFLQEEKGLKLLWIGERRKDKTDFPQWTRYLTGFDLVTGAPNFLLGWVGGAGASMIEHVSDHEIGQVCLRIFRSFLPEKKLPNLVSAHKSTWSAEAHIRGAYSYPSLKNVDRQIDGVWDPLEVDLESNKIPRVLFAGEATSSDMYATAHGAIFTGWREADRLLRLRKTSQQVPPSV